MTGPTQDQLVGMYRMMVLIREFELFCQQHHVRGDKHLDVLPRYTGKRFDIVLHGMMHLCTGQEAAAVGACTALGPDDYTTTSYRNHGQLLARGAEPGPMLAEIVGLPTGYNGGRAGSMHLTVPEVNHVGSFSGVASQIAVGVGAAMSAKLKTNGRVAACFFGDGALNNGVCHESMNLAAVWKAPIVFFCENNGYSMWTPIKTTVAIDRLCARAESCGIPAVQVDGNDVVEVHRAMTAAVERARAGGGPSFIEAMTYRMCGHTVGDTKDGMYRPVEEVAQWTARDPIARLERVLLDAGLAARLDEVRAGVAREMDKAVRFVLDSPPPRPEDIEAHLFAGGGS